MADLTGRRLGPYELTEKLGQGGMGAVYIGVHQTLHVSRAIKVLLPNEVDEAVVERFVREGVISASLRHPNIVEIFDVGEQDGIHFLVMELIEGQSLLQLLRAVGGLTVERTVYLLRQVAAALDYAHARGVVHRDIKPSNIIVDDKDEVTLIDFGIARALDESRLTRVGVVVGTFEYMAPEVVTQGGGSPGADRYALAIVAYQMLTGRAPFTGQSAHSIMFKQVNEPPPAPRQFRPDLPEPVEQALLRQLSKKPDDRFPSSQAFVDALAAGLASTQPTQAATLADITRPGFEKPTPGSGQTPMPQSGRVTRPAPAATLTPPGVRPIPNAPLTSPSRTAPQYTPPPMGSPSRTAAQFTPSSAGMAPPPLTAPASGAAMVPLSASARQLQTAATMAGTGGQRTPVGLIVALVAALLALVALATIILVPSVRQAVLGQAETGPVAEAPAKPAAKVATAQPATAQPATAQPATSTPRPATPTAQAPTATAQPATPTSRPVPPTLTPAERLGQVREASAAGNHAAALGLLDELRVVSPALPGLDDAQYDVHLAFARSLLQQNNLDGSYEQFGAALKVRPNDAAALDGQKQIVLQKNYAIMERAWDAEPDVAIKALEENMALDAGFRDTRQKLYALLIAKADRLTEVGERDAAFETLMRALQVLPEATEARQRLARYTPTPTPAPPPVVQPQQKPSSSGTTAAPAQRSTGTSPSSGSSSSGGGYPGSGCAGGVCP